MEEIFELWGEAKRFPQFKAENWYHNRTPSCLIEAAHVIAKFQDLSSDETEALVNEYLHYGVPLQERELSPCLHYCMGFVHSAVIISPTNTKSYRRSTPS